VGFSWRPPSSGDEDRVDASNDTGRDRTLSGRADEKSSVTIPDCIGLYAITPVSWPAAHGMTSAGMADLALVDEAAQLGPRGIVSVSARFR